MYVSLWNYCRGYVIVEVRGIDIEKMLNLALKANISFWDVNYTGNSVRLKTTIYGFKRLKPYAKRSKCTIRITDKRGLPFFTFRYRKRNVFLLGSMLFIMMLYILTSFVWLIEVKGNEDISTVDLITTLEQGGYTEGKLKRNLDLRAAESYLQQQYPEIMWIAIQFEGTKMVVQVVEVVPEPEMHVKEEGLATDLIAKRDGLITYIVTEQGVPLVKKGDIVRKGDVIVSGRVAVLDQEEIEPSYTQAAAQVKARTMYVLEATMPIEVVQKEYNGQVKSIYSVRLFDKQLTLPYRKIEEEMYDTLVTINQLQLTNRLPLPFYFQKKEILPYTENIQVREVEYVQEMLKGALYNELLSKLGTDDKIIDYKLKYSQDGKEIAGTLYAVVEEDIGIPNTVTKGINEIDH